MIGVTAQEFTHKKEDYLTFYYRVHYEMLYPNKIDHQRSEIGNQRPPYQKDDSYNDSVLFSVIGRPQDVVNAYNSFEDEVEDFYHGDVPEGSYSKVSSIAGNFVRLDMFYEKIGTLGFWVYNLTVILLENS